MNKTIMTGRLTKDPQVRYTQSGKAVATFTLAVDRAFSRNNEANGQPTADFIPYVVWGKLAEVVGNNLQKGRKILAEGRIQTRSYDNQQGQKVFVTEIIADNIEFLDRKTDGQQGNNQPVNNQQGQTVPDEYIPF